MWAYISCPACYEAERILHIPKPLSADLMIGRFAHASLADMRAQLTQQPLDAENGKIPELLDTDRSLEVGSQAFDEVITEQRFVDEDGDVLPVEIELTTKYTNIGEAKDMAVRLTRFSLPEIAKYDRTAGIAAYEARVWHLGPALYAHPDLPATMKLSNEAHEDSRLEAEAQFVDGVKPCFPFPIQAFLDVLYLNGVLKDAKTSSRNGSPDRLAALQLLMYGMPWHDAGEPLRLGWDVMIKTKNPNFASYWINGTGVVTDEQYETARYYVLAAADGICEGRFPANLGSMFCKYEHLGVKGERAVMDFPVAV